MTDGEPEPNLVDEPGDWESRYTKSKLRTPLHCTASDDGPCHVVENLQAWNEFLCPARLELRECCPGKLCLNPFDHGPSDRAGLRRKRKALILVYWLLVRHRCLVDVHVVASSGFQEYDVMISRGLRRASALKALRIDSVKPESRLLPLGPTPGTPFLTSLEELHCDVLEAPLGLLESICSIVESSGSLKTVSLPNLRVSSLEAGLLWDALSRASTLTALSINASALLPTNGYQRSAISKFVETAATLTALGISSSGYWPREELASVVRYLRRPQISVSSVSLRSFSVDDEASREIRLLLTEKDALRIFKLEDCQWYGVRSGPAGWPRYDTDDFGSLSSRILPWLVILQRNSTLEELQLKINGFCPAECVAFFQALRSNKNLRKVTIEDIDTYFSARGCRIGTVDPTLDNYQMVFPECERRSKVRLSLLHMSDMNWFTITILRLQSLDTITTLELDIGLLMQDETVGSLVAEYIQKTTFLKELTLNFHLTASWLLSVSVCKLAILSALSQNASLRILSVKSVDLDEQEVQLLASAVKRSGSMGAFTLHTSDEGTDRFVKGLSPGFSRNFSLVYLNFRPGVSRLSREWFDVRNVVRRNYCLVTRGAHFAAGRNRSRHCAEALEPVASSTALVDKVSELASLSEREAMELILESLSSLQSRSGFLRAAGVIRSTFALRARPDHRPQLDSLDEKSWLYLRRYLYVGDVLNRA